MGSFGPQILAHALPTALVLFTCPLRSDLKRTPLAGRGRWAEVKYDHCQANSRRRGLKGVAAARGRRAAWSEQSFAFARVLAQSTNTIEEAGRALLSLHKVCSAPKVPVASSHQPSHITLSFLRFGTAPLSRVAQAASCLNSEFGFFSRPSWARKKRMPTRAPQAVMNTRQGLSPLSTSKNQLDAVYADAVWKRLDAETVWLHCPVLSKEGVASQPALQLTTTRAPS